MVMDRVTVKNENLTSYGLAEAINAKYTQGYLLRGVELFVMGGRPYVDFYFQREMNNALS